MHQDNESNLENQKITGYAVKIIELNPTTQLLSFKHQALKKVLDLNNAHDKPICICSVSGDFRKGKSFILNYLIRFLSRNSDYLNKKSLTINSNWLGKPTDPLTGFGWRSGCDLKTTGVWIWSELFSCKIPKNKQNLNKETESEFEMNLDESNFQDACICLIDAQGTFDCQNSFIESANIFSIVSLISSMQIFNILHHVQEDNLQYLQLFTEYGKILLKENIKNKPFQRFTFLIRDWFSPSEFNYGKEGGENYIKEYFFDRNKLSTKHKQNLNTRKSLKKIIDKIDCFLLPYPGSAVASSGLYNGNYLEMDSLFLDNLKSFAEWWFEDLRCKFSTDYLPKKITGKDFFNLIDIILNKLNENKDLLKPMTIIESMSKLSHLNALEDCVQQYKNDIDSLFGSSKPYVRPYKIKKICKFLDKKYLKIYMNKKKFGGKNFEKEFIEKLNNHFKEIFNNYLSLNQLKCPNIPAYLLSIMIILITYFLSKFVFEILNFKFINTFTELLITAELFLFFLSVCVEIFGLSFGSNFINFFKKNFQALYYISRTSNINYNEYE